MKENKKHLPGRKFIQQTAMAGAGLMLGNPLRLFSQENGIQYMGSNIKSKG